VGNAVELWRELLTRDRAELAELRDREPADLFDSALAVATGDWQETHRLTKDGVVGNRESWPMMIRLLVAAPIGAREEG
jgi:hypothetical protein